MWWADRWRVGRTARREQRSVLSSKSLPSTRGPFLYLNHSSYSLNKLDRNSLLAHRTVGHLPYPVTPSPVGSHAHRIRTDHVWMPRPSDFRYSKSASGTSTNRLRVASEPPDNRSLVTIVGDDKRVQRRLEQAYLYTDDGSVLPQTDKLRLPMRYPGNPQDLDEVHTITGKDHRLTIDVDRTLYRGDQAIIRFDDIDTEIAIAAAFAHSLRASAMEGGWFGPRTIANRGKGMMTSLAAIDGNPSILDNYTYEFVTESEPETDTGPETSYRSIIATTKRPERHKGKLYTYSANVEFHH